MNAKINPAIIVFPASNCERDMAQVLKDVYELDVKMVFHTEETLPPHTTHIILPGGFSFGDYLRAGAIASHSPIMGAVIDAAQSGVKTLGVCNGFQILCEARLLPGVLQKNHHDRFICRKEDLLWYGTSSKLREPLSITLPLAHREGRYYASDEVLDILERDQQIILRYRDREADGTAQVNGSSRGIAGIIGGAQRNIIGMMPHPERMAHPDKDGRDGCVILQEFLFG